MTATVTEGVLVARRGRVLVITLNRPQARNAVDAAVAHAIEGAIDELENDPGLDVAVIAGNGPAFCAGMDLKAFARGESPRTARRGFAGIAAAPPAKPVIAAVEGAAFGGGLEIVLACDIVVASETARFALPEASRGLIASSGGLIRLPRRIPYNRALELALTARVFDAREAFDLGLLARVVAPGEALAAGLEIAEVIVKNAPLAVAATKRVIQESADWPVNEAFARQEPIANPIRESNDAREGARAFAEKRAPRWTGS